ncbi:hypothetical protein RSOLAG22IIIB_10596 [Rhizoctonia solani]|uniref:Extracellular membrane protein CFEM domain-containing protein n=1 Tax=Rhizoctonia solani TaxID=456999 RepID=A0A0K6G3Q2_9AGAM|nr:hypothetical protein RSOLAG22IIIB_10596 [Rhizoctonia solani]
MRFPAVFVLALAMSVLGQTNSEPNVFTPTADPEPSPAPETTLEPSSPLPTSEPPTSITPAPDSSTTPSTIPLPTPSSAAPPSGGGATQTYLSVARTCFTNSACDESASQAAVQDYGSACGATTTPVESSVGPSTRPAATVTPTPTSRTRTALTTQTIAFTSGAVISISRGVSSTVTSGFTTVRTGQAGDFGDGGGSAPTSGSDAGSANNGALGTSVGHLTSAGMMMGLGVVGGIAVLAF